MKYSETHEWIEIEDIKIVKVGITKFAVKQIGEIVNVVLPKNNIEVKKEDEVAVLESNKAASGVYSPLNGKIIEVNKRLEKDLSLLNKSPETEGWIFKMEIENLKDIDHLLDKENL